MFTDESWWFLGGWSNHSLGFSQLSWRNMWKEIQADNLDGFELLLMFCYFS